MTYFDYHVHNRVSFDSTETLENHCEQAIQRGLTEIALTNHYELDMVLQGTAAAPDFEREERDLREAQAHFAGRLTVLRGIELGQPEYSLPDAEKLLAERAYDVVLGSVHNGLNGEDYYFLNCDDYTDGGLQQLWTEYLERLARVAATAPVDVMTHILYPLRYFKAERRACLPLDEGLFEPIFTGLIGRGIALEINTAALRKGASAEPDPGLRLLKFYRSLGGEYLTVGSDAHRAKDIGTNQAEARALAEAAGFRYLTTFRKRKPILEALS